MAEKAGAKYRDLGELKPIRFVNSKRNSSIANSNNTSLLGTAMKSTFARDIKMNQKPLDMMKSSGMKDVYLNTLARVDQIDRESLEQRRKILKTVQYD